MLHKNNSYGDFTHIDWKLAAYPYELSRIHLELLDAAQMRLSHVGGVSPQRVNHLQIVLEHVRVLVIFGVYVLSNRRRERELQRPAERYAEYIVGWPALQKLSVQRLEQRIEDADFIRRHDGRRAAVERTGFWELRITNVVKRKRQKLS